MLVNLTLSAYYSCQQFASSIMNDMMAQLWILRQYLYVKDIIRFPEELSPFIYIISYISLLLILLYLYTLYLS